VRATDNSAAVPLPAELNLALRKVTEQLARELAFPSRDAPDWTPFEWTVARAVAAMHGISALLSRSLHWSGPDVWTVFLSAQRMHTRARHARIQDLLRSVAQEARNSNLVVTALKGAALHELNVYDAGDRPMADLDLLVRPADTERAVALLQGLGFVQSAESWKERLFTPASGSDACDFGEHESNGLKIELHERICERLPLRLTDISACIFPRAPQPGLNYYPSKAALMRHLLLHAAGSMAFQALRILQLHDVALLARQMSDLDWLELCGTDLPHGLWWAYPPLELVTRRYSSCIPKHVLETAKGDCPLILRALGARKSLVDVSYSYLWVKAFPGIEWSQSPLAMIQYGLSRVRPNKAHIARRKHDADSQSWAKWGDWANMSQSRRIVSWLSSRRTRPVTMHVVARAFAET
jgi:hypothetical protein